MFAFVEGVTHFLTVLQIIANIAVGLFALAVGLAAWAVCHWWAGRRSVRGATLTPKERASLALFGIKDHVPDISHDKRVFTLAHRPGLFSYNDVVAEYRESARA